MAIGLLIGGIFIFVVFIFCLALCGTAKRPTPSLKHPHPTILVIDDNTNVLNMIRLGLENEGYIVIAASKPREGIELFRKQSQSISLVLLDFCMPEMNGGQVFDCLRKINAEAPVLLITGFCEDIQMAKQLRNNVEGFLLKPFHLGDLIGKVREIVNIA
ncbi:MAG: response regulator [Verrucomicrobiia bacterium]|jgi:DNA-binding response OmpR family regulator